MANSITFNDTDLSIYGLMLLSSDLPVSQDAVSIRVKDRAYAGQSSLMPKLINLDVAIQADSFANLKTYFDTIKSILNTREDASLKLDILNDRYWLVRFEALTGRFHSPLLWRGILSLMCHDPLAYSTSETSSDFNIDADPKTVTEAVGGTAEVEPVFTLTAGENLTGITLKVENETRDEELQWEGDLANGEVLVIDVSTWLVTKEGTADMASVSGKFPKLQPGMTNSIKVTGFSTTGTLNITYRNRYL